jgi:hypothetical protein
MFGLKIKMFLDTAAVVIEHLGWESVFYLTGGFSLAWVVAWAFLVYDTPAQHPRYSGAGFLPFFHRWNS